MKTTHLDIHHIVLLLIAAVAVSVSIHSCTADDPYAYSYRDYEYLGDRFDFKTSEYMPINITAPAGCYVALYERDPRLNDRVMPFFSTFTNADGKFSEKVDVPQHLVGQEIYVSANGNVFKAKLDSKGISYSPAMSRSDNKYTVDGTGITVDYGLNSDIKSYYDKIMLKNTDNTKLVDTLVAGIDIETMENNTQVVFSLVNVTGRYMMQIYYFYYPVERTSHGQSNFQDEGKMAEFIKRFIRPEFCISRQWQNDYTGTNMIGNVLGEGDNEVTINETFCKVKYDATGKTTNGWINRNFQSNLNSQKSTVLLNYYGWFNSQGQFEKIDNPTTLFPEAYKIGFFMYVAVPKLPNNGSGTGYKADYTDYYKSYDKTAHYYIVSTDRIINNTIDQEMVNGTPTGNSIYKHYDRMCATRMLSYDTDGIPCIVYGMEDNLTGTDNSAKDYNDLFFTVQTNPLVDTSDIPVIGQGYYAYEGTLLYEDLYPNAGDYDMNDVIVEYTYKLIYEHTNKGNKVKSINYEFIPVWNGATYVSDFYLNIRQKDRPDQQLKICENINAIATANAEKIRQNIAEGKDVSDGLTKLTGTIGGKNDKSGLDLSNIIGQYVRDLDIRNYVLEPFLHVVTTNYEVHLPGNVAVLPGTKKCENDEMLKYYHVSAKDVYNAMGLETPFAANIALKSVAKEPGFRQCAESYTIDNCYHPVYAEWVVSRGTKCKNWYLRYNYTGPY